PKGEGRGEGERDAQTARIEIVGQQLSNSQEQFTYTQGLIAVSPAADLARFFPDRFYLEISTLDHFEKTFPPLPCVASLPIHYAQPSDRLKYDIVQSIRTLTLLRQQHPEKRFEGHYHFLSA